MTNEESIKKVYRGARKDDGAALVSVNGEPLTHIVKHSPAGLEWGYGGSGPADTALSILCDHFGELPSEHDLYHGLFRAARLYQHFKWDFIASALSSDFEITSDQIADFLHHYRIVLEETDERIQEARAMTAERDEVR